MVATTTDGKLRRSQLLQETDDFCGEPQEKVAKIVQCGEKFLLNHQEKATCEGGPLVLLLGATFERNSRAE